MVRSCSQERNICRNGGRAQKAHEAKKRYVNRTQRGVIINASKASEETEIALTLLYRPLSCTDPLTKPRTAAM